MTGKSFAILALIIASPPVAIAAEDLQPALAFSAHALVQLEAVYAEKLTRDPAQRKMDTALVLELRESRRDAIAAGVPRMPQVLRRDTAQRIEVDVRARVTADLLDDINRVGGQVLSSFPQYEWVRAYLPLEGIALIAERSDVRRIRRTIPPMLHKINTSQGDIAHRASNARPQFGVNGSGVRIGVLSDSVEQLAALQSSGDLPSVTVIPGQAGSGTSEGTAMLEIIHDLSPGAQLFFATGFVAAPGFANNILALKNAGCQVIVDDVSDAAAGVFQDDIVAQAVNTVTAQGVLYFSSAGNAGNLSNSTSGVWEGNFVNGGSIAGYGSIHNFGGGNVGNTVIAPAPNSRPTTLQWSDALGSSTNDYDLCAYDNSLTNLLGCSDETQDGNDDPFEVLFPGPPAGTRLVVVNFGGNQAARFLHLNTHGGRLQSGTIGQTGGHSAAANAFSIAAVNVASAGGGAFTGGGSNPVEDFSSDGPRRIFYHANGTPITPGNFLATGGTVRQKPDLAAANRVATATPGFNPFSGTSAAAPHAAAIAALMLSANPSATPTEIRTALTSTALDIMGAGVDRNSGFGIVDALAAVEAVAQGAGTDPCVRDADTACLLANRFEVEVDWQTSASSGVGQVMSFGGQRTENEESVFWWFFSPTNFEMGVKVLNACVPFLGNKYWVFVSGLTDQGWTVHVRDTQTGATRTYANAVGHLSTTFADTSAFNCP